MMKMYIGVAVALGLSLSMLSCGSDTFQTNDGTKPGGDGSVIYDGTFWPDTSTGPCQPGKDQDGDKIPDDREGCKKDTDGDSIPDYQDSDSDGDKVLDKVEAGPDPKNPVDSDGDKTPDFQDKDSDNDGIDDGAEDLNKDGKLGCCLINCGEQREGCPTVKPGECGPGQKCQSGLCVPAVDFLCSNGESDPKKKSTFGGKPDTDLPTFICREAGETGGKGLKPMKFKKNTKAGMWHVAIEPTSTYGEVAIAGAGAIQAGANFDMTGANQGVAGFIISMPATAGADVSKLSSNIISKISTSLPGKQNISQLVSGTITTSHDKFPSVVGTRLEITMSGAKNVGSVRNSLFPLLLNKTAAQITNLPSPSFGPSSTTHILAFQTLLRPKENRVLVMGAVAQKNMALDTNQQTGIHLEDISNGTGLATPADGDTVECDPFVLQSTPIADIIWIVDESGSMNDNRQDIVNNASDFFNRAVKAGLDFRMGVAGVKNPSSSGVKVGKLCSKISSSSSDDGGTDRFLKPTEQTIFKSCINNPPYWEGGSEYGLAHAFEAVTTHLPRKPAAANDLTKIRTEATLVLIIATDEAPQELKSYSSYKGKSGFLSSSDYSISNCSSSKQTQINAYVKPWLDLYQGKHATHGMQAKAIVHMIAGVCKKSCGSYGPEYPWGYQELVKGTGGQQGDICQKNLGTTLQLIIDSISGAASPAVLQYVPISASLAVALNKTQLTRSRKQGFDYVSSSNSLVFIQVKFTKGDQVVTSYRRWIKQAGPIG